MNYQSNQIGTALGSKIEQAISSSGWGAAPAEARLPEIESQMQALNREASEIAAYIDSLENRFQKILQPSSPANQATGGNTPYHTMLGSELGELAERLRSSRLRLDSILQRAEL
ncbi:hypothetical protein [Cupriavidus metallidurans]|uniref:hypothetical protein n=1 Tax=Cupriavidus metallidurans TaxID=119219 RepID=UPI00164712A2|nr:hypothetical protein [Cupriavidus metallidurans]